MQQRGHCAGGGTVKCDDGPTDLSHRSGEAVRCHVLAGASSCHSARCSAAHPSSAINLPNVASTLMERGRFGKHGTVRYRSAGATHLSPRDVKRCPRLGAALAPDVRSWYGECCFLDSRLPGELLLFGSWNRILAGICCQVVDERC